MKCPFCNNPSTSVVRSEDNARRRHCKKCCRRWNTREVLDADVKMIERTRAMLAELGFVVSGEEA